MEEQKPARRVRIDLSTPAETAIRLAVSIIENNMPPDVRLTKAQTLLDEARNLVADFIDEQIKGTSYD